jgi:hypothetical protein
MKPIAQISIRPLRIANHNQTLVRSTSRLALNQNQTVVRSRLAFNHNQTVAGPQPIRIPNHNQTLVRR